jgi:hypothetical protein
MLYARTLFALLALVSTLPPTVATEKPASHARRSESTVAVESGADRRDHRREPWYADYPASQEIDGAMAYAQTPEQIEDLRWALERYAAAGLDLPHVEAWLHDRRTFCDGPVRKGRSGFATWRNDVSILFNCGSRHTLLHELGHVYDRHTLTDADRAAFMALRGVTEWQADVWLQSGQEHLADVLAWALSPASDRHAQTEPRDEASLWAAYELSTGLEPLPWAQRGKEGRL